MGSVNHSRGARPKSELRRGAATPENETCEQPIDLEHLARQTLGDETLEREVLALFLSQGDIFLARLRTARSAESWRLAAHTIKGSARNIGAWQLAETARAAEEMTPADRRSKAMADKVANMLERTNSFIETRLMVG